ncbi:MAG TPA: zinc ribbon domain-containing protein [Pseudolysinimonas sp.]|nr:zinc ribbon domain-containing protein [Pseudolysinimonas sp.]
MSVAPQAVTVFPQAAVAPRFSCALCGARIAPSSAYCSHCGAAHAVATDRTGRPVDLAATRSLQLAILVIVANIVVGALALGVVVLTSDTKNLVNAALALELLHFLVVGGLVAASISYGVRGIRETRDGRLGRRNWAVLSIVVSGLVGVVLAGSLTATFVMFLHQA